MALGAFEATPFEIAQAYSTFANGGVSVTPFGIKSVTREGATEDIAAAKTKVLSPTAAYIVTETLAEAVDRGTATRVRGMGYRGPAAGKTGSSHDAWFAAYTPNLLAVVWVGFDDYNNLGMVGGDAAAPIWTNFVIRALALRPDLRAEKFIPPAGVEEAEIDHKSDRVTPVWRKKYLAPTRATRQRSVRKIRPAPQPAPARSWWFHPMIDQTRPAPRLLYRRQVRPVRR
jgi:penicillin-binding protein 1B